MVGSSVPKNEKAFYGLVHQSVYFCDRDRAMAANRVLQEAFTANTERPTNLCTPDTMGSKSKRPVTPAGHPRLPPLGTIHL
jgi:hypothetical protein